MLKNTCVSLITASLLIACSSGQPNSNASVNSVRDNVSTTSLNTTNKNNASQQANIIFDEMFDKAVARYPEWQTYLGIKTNNDKWNDLSEAFAQETLALNKADLATLQAMDTSTFDEKTKVSHSLYVQRLTHTIDDFQWRYYNYPINQMFGKHAQIPAFLINQHEITNEKDAQDYISRVRGIDNYLAQLIQGLKKREQLGVVPPKFVFTHVIRDANNIISGAPFNGGEASTVLADFSAKVNKLALSDEKKTQLINDVTTALKMHLKPGYDNLITYLTYLETKADDRAGVWKFERGDDFFNNALKRTTTTNLTSDEIHQLGLKEVSRIHQEMSEIKDKVGFTGSLKQFMTFMRTDKQFYYPNTDEGKAEYLAKAIDVIDDMEGRLDSLFLTKPKAKLKVKAVEAFREQSAGKAFYQAPAPDGSRPGIYYANLYNMSSMPTYQLEALAYHEGIPGHHMQIAIKQELTDMPKFRKFGGYTAYIEGWGLYSEFIPKEIGLYQDPYSDFGRLAMELWRACRLVVDTGIHTQKWTREQGIQYYVDNTPDAKADAIKMVERHIVMPSQATAYKIGMIKILELRQKSKMALGDKFDIREYHDVILKNGPVPLNVLAELVDEYIAAKMAQSK